MLAVQHGLEALLDQPLARPKNGRQAGVQSFHDPTVTPAFACLRDISLEQDPGFEHLSRRPLARADQGIKLLTLVRAQADDISLDLGFWHDAIPGNVPITLLGNHRIWSESTTWG